MRQCRRWLRARLGLLALAGAAAALTAGCVRRTVSTEIVDVTPIAAQEQRLKPAANLPASFQVVTPARIEGDCPVRLRDLELQVLLTLSHSLMLPVRDTTTDRGYAAYGDYTIQPQGSYGDEAGEGLRIECRRLRALGIVILLR